MEGNPMAVPLTVSSSSDSSLISSSSLSSSTVGLILSKASAVSSNTSLSSSETVAASHVTPQTAHFGGKPKSFMSISLSGSEGKKGGSKKSAKSTPSRGHGSKVGKSAEGTAPTRSSQRQIKRPKTDEELVNCEASSRSGVSSKKIKTSTSSVKGSGGSKVGGQKKSSRSKLSSAAKNLGRWRPTDDLMLISGVLQTNDLAAVHLGVKFSCRFTFREIEERWYALLYEPQISKLALDAIRALHPGVVTMALNNALWSQEEEQLLAKIVSSDPGHLETFQKLLADSPAVFHPCRTATSLHHHWVLMGHYNLLSDQRVDVIPPGDSVVNFTDAEDLTNDNELMKPRDVKEEAMQQEIMVTDRQVKKQIMKLEEELPEWRMALEIKSIPDFEPGVYAILKGRVVQFMMRMKEVTVGRSSASSQVTFDLSLEGPAYKVSRKQATIQLGGDNLFHIINNGRRPIYLSGRALVTGETAQLQTLQVLEISSFSFMIYLNPCLGSS